MINHIFTIIGKIYPHLPRVLVGFFFLAAAHHKLMQGFFGPHPVPLNQVFQYWITNHLTPLWMASILTSLTPIITPIALLVILLQALAGIALICNYHVRICIIPLFLLQLSIYIATYYHPELRVLGSQTLWILTIFFLGEEKDRQLWHLATVGVFMISVTHLLVRYRVGDPFLSAVPWQYEHFTAHVLGVSPLIKFFVHDVMQTSVGPLLWAGSWWLKAILVLGFLTPYRLYTGTALLLLMTSVELTWMNAWNCEGAMCVLFLFVWLVREYEEEKEVFIQ